MEHGEECYRGRQLKTHIETKAKMHVWSSLRGKHESNAVEVREAGGRPTPVC
jgi:hypothetical protein